jgi:hypothetical protein
MPAHGLTSSDRYTPMCLISVSHQRVSSACLRYVLRRPYRKTGATPLVSLATINCKAQVELEPRRRNVRRHPILSIPMLDTDLVSDLHAQRGCYFPGLHIRCPEVSGLRRRSLHELTGKRLDGEGSCLIPSRLGCPSW